MITRKTTEEVANLLEVEYINAYADNSLLLILEELAKKYYGNCRVSKEKVLRFAIAALDMVAHDLNEDRYFDWKYGLYEKFETLLEAHQDEFFEDDFYTRVVKGDEE